MLRGPLSLPRRLLLVAVLGTGLLLPLATPPRTHAEENVVARAAAALYEGIRSEQLPNGMRIYLKPVPHSPVVTTLVAYKVGSADEDLSHTGLAHYLEHLMFKGTEKLMPGDIDRMTLRSGGSNNAFTTEDYTAYFFSLPAEHWDFALQIEADRMRNLRIDARHEFQQEKGAVIGELERNEDEPWDLEQKALLPLLFDHGPYGHPIIGERDHVRGATAETIKGYYDRWYHPNNASLVICGGFDPDQALTRIKELFGPLPAGKLPERRTATPVQRSGPVHKEIPSKFDTARLLLAYNTVSRADADFYALEVVDAILSDGKTGRLYKKLVEGDSLARSVSSSNTAGRYSGYFAIEVEQLPGKERAKTEQVVLAELQRLQDQPVSPAELQRVKRNLIASAIFGRESVQSLAESIARGVTVNDLDYLKHYLPRLQAVTTEEVQTVARKYFPAQQRVVVWSVPEERAGLGGRLGASQPPQRHQSQDQGAFSLKDTRRVVLPNGLTLLLLENHRLPIVVADVAVKDVALLEPGDRAGVATLTGSLLDEGTTRHTGQQIAELIENVGGALSMSSSGGALKVLTPDRHLGLQLLFECLTQATFPREAFARKQAQLLSMIADSERQPEFRAETLYRGLVYGKHPFGRPVMGRREAVEKLTPEECRSFHHRVFVPNNTIVALVGDFNSQQMIDEMTALTANWKASALPRPTPPAVTSPKQFEEHLITMPTAAQLHFYMGHGGIRRHNPDYYKLLVMDYVLGTGSGFTDRLSSRLRDREGLGYTVYATISSSAGEEPGLFTCYIGTTPDALGKVKRIFLEELERIRTHAPSKEEVEDAKMYLLGSLPFKFTTNSHIAGILVAVERYHLGLDYVEQYRQAVAAVTPEDVREVAHKYLDPKRMILVAAGAVDQNGKPIQVLPPPRK
jgi:zinc protease